MRSAMNSWSYLSSCLLVLVSPFSSANEYIPPPTGPYQSSVVIRSIEQSPLQYKAMQQGSGPQIQVYKFPSADLFEQEAPSQLEINRARQREKPEASLDIPTEAPVSQTKTDVVPRQRQYPAPPDFRGQGSRSNVSGQPAARSFQYSNPWSANHAPEQRGYPDVWGNPGYPDTYQYPYGYSDQYNSMNAPNYRMPSPWSAMPMQPYNPGR